MFGKNFVNDLPAGAAERTSKEPGAWRLELSPRSAAAEDHFFTVLQTTDARSNHRLPVQRTDHGERVGCVIRGEGVSWLVLLRKDSTRSEQPVELTASGENPTKFLVTDLTPGRWEAKRSGSAATHMINVTADAGAAWFEGASGSWTLTRTSAN